MFLLSPGPGPLVQDNRTIGDLKEKDLCLGVTWTGALSRLVSVGVLTVCVAACSQSCQIHAAFHLLRKKGK